MMTEFQMHLRWLAEQRRLQDLERRWREAEKVALRELLLASSDDDAENETVLEVSDDGENED
jgi:siroheme synthase (precorrin-2 oxidase/ferrochelatase)